MHVVAIQEDEMRKRPGHVFLAFLSAFALATSAYCAGGAIIVDKSIATIDVYFPASGGKLPVVFFAHNGGAKKEDWSDYPHELAEEGFFVANLGWTENNGYDDLASAIDTILKKYQNRGTRTASPSSGAATAA